jgi:hypothetical protein
VLDEPGLTDPRLAHDQKQSSPAVDRVFQAGEKFRDFPVAADEGTR